jgi:hypothetical protein
VRYRVSFPQTATFSGKLGNYLFMGKGIRRVGVELADFLNPVDIPTQVGQRILPKVYRRYRVS